MAHTSGILILRAWGEDDGLRVRITQVVGRTERSVTALASVQDTVDTVRRWLEELSSDGAQV